MVAVVARRSNRQSEGKQKLTDRIDVHLQPTIGRKESRGEEAQKRDVIYVCDPTSDVGRNIGVSQHPTVW